LEACVGKIRVTMEEKDYYRLTKRAFDMLAPFYNMITWPLFRAREQVVGFVHPAVGSAVLDVATGTGQQAFAFAKRGCTVTAVDLTDSMLEIAVKHNKYDSVRFETADATHLRFNKNSFDVTCVSFALHDMPLTIRRQVLKEMVRVTRPDGTILIVDYGLPQNNILRALIYRLVRSYEGAYYREFIASGLGAVLAETGIEVRESRSVFFGAVRILKGGRKP
jgi:ubiquinone/menaquinone biosynthesis C-methylase UbiE